MRRWRLAQLQDEDAIVRKGIRERPHECVVTVQGLGERYLRLWVTVKIAKRAKEQAKRVRLMLQTTKE
jgi:hypothetical protein